MIFVSMICSYCILFPKILILYTIAVYPAHRWGWPFISSTVI